METTSQHHECCHVLQKPDLYDAIKLAFLTENNLSFVKTSYVEGDRLDEENKLALSVLWYHSSQILNFMEQKRFKWKIGDSFSLKTSLALKETIIDTFIRLRLKEGFKCLFQWSKFCVFTIQLQCSIVAKSLLDLKLKRHSPMETNQTIAISVKEHRLAIRIARLNIALLFMLSILSKIFHWSHRNKVGPIMRQ